MLLAAFVVQSIAVQSHVHADRAAAPAQSAAAVGHSQLLGKGKASGAADTCLLCWEAAMAGHFVVPAIDVLPPAPEAVRWLGNDAVPRFALPRPPPGWLSRAPPN